MSVGIVFQNKDIEFNLLSDVYKEKSFEAYGLKILRINEILSINLPTTSANENLVGSVGYANNGYWIFNK